MSHDSAACWQMDLGLFDPKPDQKFFQSGIDLVHSDEHRRHAMEAAQQSIVLLKNEGGLLPLKRGQKIAVIGPHAMGTEVFLSNYHGSACLNATGGIGGTAGFGAFVSRALALLLVTSILTLFLTKSRALALLTYFLVDSADCIVTPLQALNTSNIGGSTVGVPCNDIACHDFDQPAAIAAAKAADVVVMVMGIDDSIEREGGDRYNTTLPGAQPQIVQVRLPLPVLVFSTACPCFLYCLSLFPPLPVLVFSTACPCFLHCLSLCLPLPVLASSTACPCAFHCLSLRLQLYRHRRCFAKCCQLSAAYGTAGGAGGQP